MILSKEEIKIIELIRTGRLSKLELFFNDEKVCRLHGTENFKPGTPIRALKTNFPYQEISLIQKEGKEVLVQRIFKQKL